MTLPSHSLGFLKECVHKIKVTGDTQVATHIAWADISLALDTWSEMVKSSQYCSFANTVMSKSSNKILHIIF